MKATKLPDIFRETLLSVVLTAKAWLVIWDVVAAKKVGLDPHLSTQEELLFWKERWDIPNDIDLRNMILNNSHNSKIAEYFVIYRTPERMKHYYHWHKIKEDVKDCILACDKCQRDEPSCHRWYVQLEPLEVSYRPWSSISMHWIVDLPELNRHTQIWVIVDTFTRRVRLIPWQTKVSAEYKLKIILKEIWITHWLPTDIVSSQDIKLTLHPCQVLINLLVIKIKLSTSYHEKTNGQTDRVNQTIEQYLHHEN